MSDVRANNGCQGESVARISRDQARADAAVRAVDLFCGAGGLTRGLEKSGIDVTLGVDVDSVCRYPYTSNNGATFLQKPIEEVMADDLPSAFHGAPYRLLAGCAPCQPFSTYSRSRSRASTVRWNLLDHFGRLVREVKPHLVTTENVPMLQREQVFSDFVDTLQGEGFAVATAIVNCADYGVPQYRRRLVVLASTLGPIDLVPPTTPEARRPTVRAAIADMPPLDAGGESGADALHRSSRLSPLNVRRIRASKPGGTWRDWDDALIAECHRKPEGRTYPSMYGRMEWDHPSPTVTTQYYGLGNGRFGHPEQDRAISLREGAILQSFPREYRFVEPGEPVSVKTIGRLVGNAVPVNLGHAIGSSLVRHVENHHGSINVNYTSDIPEDYEGAMGVPITFLTKHNPDQFEILGATESEGRRFSDGMWDSDSGVAQSVVRNQRLYKRLFIRRKKDERERDQRVG